MAVFLATWNPDRYTQLTSRWESEGKEIASSGSLHNRWATGNRTGGVEIGDGVFLVRQVRERGIVRYGNFTSCVYEGEHWDAEQQSMGVRANFADVVWRQQVEIDDRLPIEVLVAQVPAISWNSLYASGVQVPQDSEHDLLELWESHVGKASPSTQRNPDWTLDEEILALAVYLRVGLVGESNPEVQELSVLLQHLSIHSESVRTPTFRNVNGVARKLSDLHTHKPGYEGKQTNGSKLDTLIWQRYGNDPGKIETLAKSIRNGADFVRVAEDDEAEMETTHFEGRIFYRMHRRRERDPKIRKRKLAQMLKVQGALTCEACDVSLERRYGAPGTMIYECHHIQPLSISGETVTELTDVAILCPNCHRFAHRIVPWPNIDELRSRLRDAPRS